MNDLLYIAIVSIFLWEVGKAIVKFIWEEVKPRHHQFYGPTHKQMYDWNHQIDKRKK